MASIIVLIFSILLFSGIARLLGKELLSKRHLFGYGSGYNRTALRVERNYKIMAFVVLAAMLMWAVVTSMIALLMTDPF